MFNQCLEIGVFPSEWKKGNIVLIHKKTDKRMLKNYRQGHWYLLVGKFLKD